MNFVYNFVDSFLTNLIFTDFMGEIPASIPPDVYQWYVVGITLFICSLIIYLPTLVIYKFIKMFDRGLI